MIAIEFILLLYFIYVVGYAAFFSVAAYFYRSPKISPVSPYSKYAHARMCFLIPAYKEDAVIVETANKAIHQSYPRERFEVIVVADKLQPSTVSKLNQLPIKVIEVTFAQSTKVNSLRRALNSLEGQFDYAIILDADNIVAHNFLEKINSLIQSSRYRAIQVKREPKNQNNRLSFLDGVSEAINTRIYRQGATAVGLSSSITGSGFVVEMGLLQKCMAKMNSVGGFDRELELLLLKEGAKVYYYGDAHVKDEKVTDQKVFQGQRRRWIASQYFYLRKYFGSGMRALLKGDLVFFNSAVLRNVQLPRLINLGLLFIASVALLLFKSSLYFGYYWWPGLLVANVISILISIPTEFYSQRLFNSVVELPLVFLRMTALLFRMKGANQTFIHTPHTNDQTR